MTKPLPTHRPWSGGSTRELVAAVGEPLLPVVRPANVRFWLGFDFAFPADFVEAPLTPCFEKLRLTIVAAEGRRAFIAFRFTHELRVLDTGGVRTKEASLWRRESGSRDRTAPRSIAGSGRRDREDRGRERRCDSQKAQASVLSCVPP